MEIFANFTICSHFYHVSYLSSVNDYTEDMAALTVLANIYSTEYFCNIKVAGLGDVC